VNLGIKQPVEDILKAAKEASADAIGLSGLLVKSTLIMKENLDEMNRRGITLPVILGGAALTRKFVEEDLTALYGGKVFYGRDAFSGLEVMDEIAKSGLGTDQLNDAETVDPSLRGRQRSCQDAAISKSEIAPVLNGCNDDKSKITNPIPKPPFWGYKVLKYVPLDQVFQLVNQNRLFVNQWQFKKGDLSLENHRKFIQEKAEPIFKQLIEKCIRERILRPQATYGFYPCYSEGNDLVVLDEGAKKEKMRFTFPAEAASAHGSIASYFRPKKSGELDAVGFQLVTVGRFVSELTRELFNSNQYTDYLYLHGLSVETAEALAEYTFRLICTDLCLPVGRGKRYSFGYPACPNLEDQKKLFELVPAPEIGVSLTETFQLVPEQSTSAIIVHHPQAKY
jgi:5-methyltetrahydrofolate--homocysteine methyltransferase